MHLGMTNFTLVVLVNSDLVDTLGVVVLPSIPSGSLLLGALHVFFRLLPEPHGTAAGNPGAAASSRRSAAFGEAAQAHPGRSRLVGLAVRGLEGLAVPSLPGPTCHGDRLAPERLSSLLDRENSTGPAGA